MGKIIDCEFCDEGFDREESQTWFAVCPDCQIEWEQCKSGNWKRTVDKEVPPLRELASLTQQIRQGGIVTWQEFCQLAEDKLKRVRCKGCGSFLWECDCAELPKGLQ